MNSLYDHPLRAWWASLVGTFVGFMGTIARNLATNKKLRRKAILFAVLVVGAFGALFAQADVDPMGNITDTNVIANAERPATLGLSVDSMATKIATGIDTAFRSLQNNQDLINTGQGLAAFALFISMLWAAFKTMATGRGLGELLAEWTPLLVAYGVVQALVFFRYPGDVTGVDLIVQSVNKFASVVAGRDVSNLKAVIYDGIRGAFDCIYNIIEMPRVSGAATDLFALGANVAMVILAKLFSALVILVAGGVYIGVMVMAMVGIVIAGAMAPILVPFLIFRPLTSLFSSWLSFLIGAGMIKLVAAFMMTLSNGIFQQMKQLAMLINADTSTGPAIFDALTADFMLFGSVMLLSILAAMLMANAPSIGAGLVSGGIGGIGFSPMQAARAARPGSAGLGGVASGGTAAYRSTPFAQEAVRTQGLRDAQAGISASAGRYKSTAQHRQYLEGYAGARGGGGGGGGGAGGGGKARSWGD